MWKATCPTCHCCSPLLRCDVAGRTGDHAERIERDSSSWTAERYPESRTRLQQGAVNSEQRRRSWRAGFIRCTSIRVVRTQSASVCKPQCRAAHCATFVCQQSSRRRNGSIVFRGMRSRPVVLMRLRLRSDVSASCWQLVPCRFSQLICGAGEQSW